MENKPPTGDGSVSIGGSTHGTIIITGDNNTATLKQVTLPPPASVDIQAEFQRLRTALLALETSDRTKIANALNEVSEELAKPEPDKAEVAGILERALGYAKKAKEFVEAMTVIQAPLVPIAAWLGAHADQLLALGGMVSK